MALHSLAPGFIRIHYAVLIGTALVGHTLTVGIKAGVWDGDDSLIDTPNVANVGWHDAVDDLVAVIRPRFSNTAGEATIVDAVLYEQDTADDEPIFVAEYPLAVAGSGSGSSSKAVQELYTFRSTEGEIIKLTLCETIAVANAYVVYAGMNASEKAVVDYAIGGSSMIYGRGNAFPNASLHLSIKTNDKLRKIRYGV